MSDADDRIERDLSIMTLPCPVGDSPTWGEVAAFAEVVWLRWDETEARAKMDRERLWERYG